MATPAALLFVEGEPMEHKGKPFKNVEEKIGILKSSGVTFEDKKIAAAFLLRENCYAVVNGYKDVFLDK